MNDDYKGDSKTTPRQGGDAAASTEALLNRRIAVPEEIINAGRPTNEPRADSPESLDADLNAGGPR